MALSEAPHRGAQTAEAYRDYAPPPMSRSARRRTSEPLLARLEGVDGWLFDREAWQLREAARTAALDAHPVIAAEIGAYVGRSTICLVGGLQARGGGHLYSIDTFNLVDDQQAKFCGNLARAGIESMVTPVHARSHDAVESVPDDVRFVVLYIDGSHEYEDVKLDVADWVPRVHPGGTVIFNDPFWRTVAHAIRDTATSSGLRNPRWVENCLFFDYEPDVSPDAVSHARLRVFLAGAHRWLRLHEAIVRQTWVPQFVKEGQLRLAHLLFGLVLPVQR